MSELNALGALGLGALTVIHPCPLTTNVAVVTMLSGWKNSVRATLAVGLAFAAGYVTCYVGLALLIGLTALSNASVAHNIQQFISPLFGPLLIVVGMLQTGLLNLPSANSGKAGLAAKLRSRDWGVVGAFGIGLLLALAFCPTTAGLFFTAIVGNLTAGSLLVLPAAFGFGVALPLVTLVILLASGLKLGLHDPQHFLRRRLPQITGSLLILIGVYLTIVRVFI